MNMEHYLREVRGDCSSSSEVSILQIIGKHKDHLTVFFFFFSLLLLLSLAWCACDSPNDSPEVLKMRSPSFRLVNLRDLWQ